MGARGVVGARTSLRDTCCLGAGDGGLVVLFYGVVSESSEEALALFVERREVERVIENWNRDEPDRADELRV